MYEKGIRLQAAIGGKVGARNHAAGIAVLRGSTSSGHSQFPMRQTSSSAMEVDSDADTEQ
jgi:hypothetical protein